MIELFLCKKYGCKLTPRACALRQAQHGAALTTPGGYGGVIAFPGCEDCAQGKEVAGNVEKVLAVPSPRWAIMAHAKKDPPRCDSCGRLLEERGGYASDMALLCRQCSGGKNRGQKQPTRSELKFE